MLPYTVNSPRAYRSKGKAKSNSLRWGILVLVLLCGGAGSLWYLRSRTAQLSTLLSVITEHENKYNHLTAENEKKDNEIRRLNRALEAAKTEKTQTQESIDAQNKRIEEAETLWRTSAAELEALKKLHDGVHGQLREALDRTSLQDQETIEARAEVAKCHELLNGSRSPVTDVKPEGSLRKTVGNLLNSSGNAVADAVMSVNSTVSNLTQQHPVNAEDEITYPGLEKAQLAQQELR